MNGRAVSFEFVVGLPSNEKGFNIEPFGRDTRGVVFRWGSSEVLTFFGVATLKLLPADPKDNQHYADQAPADAVVLVHGVRDDQGAYSQRAGLYPEVSIYVVKTGRTVAVVQAQELSSYDVANLRQQ